MTVDDETSIYIGGLPYNATEDTLRRVFAPYGSVVAVKIINDHSTRGKCYGFVTFRNPRSVISAIDDMNGKTIDGRIVKVNGVTSRGGRSNFSRERLRRPIDWDRGRDRERDYDRDRDRYHERYKDRSREHDRDRSWDHDEDRERGYQHDHEHEHARDDFFERDRSQERGLVDNVLEQGRNSDSHWGQMDGTNGDHRLVENDADQHLRKLNGSTHNNQRSTEISSDPSDDYSEEVKVQLKRSIQRQDELKKEVSQMEELLRDKQQLVSDLQKKAKKLEDSVIAAKKFSSQRRMRLKKLQNCFLQVREYTDRLKSCELELQSLVDSAMLESDMGDDVG